MLKFFSPDHLALFSARRPWLIVALWLVLIAGAVAGMMMTKIAESGADSPNAESERARTLLEASRGEQPPSENVIVISDAHDVDSAAFRSFVTDLAAEFRSLDGSVVSVTSYYEGGDASLVSADRHKTIVSVVLSGTADEAAITVPPVLDVVGAADASDGFQVLTVGDGSLSYQLDEVFKKDLVRSEIVGMPAALIILIVVFGAAAAAGLPIVLSMLSIIVAMGITGVVSQFVAMGDITQNMIVMIGLAVGIDYSLFIIERFREERSAGFEKVSAIQRAGSTASRAVLFSGFTVIIALAGLLIVPSTTFHALSLAAIAAVIGAVLAALTLLPAVLSLLGDKINALHLPGRDRVRSADAQQSGFWAAATGTVMRHPLIAIVATVVILGTASIPTATMKLGFAGVDQMPENLSTVQAFKVLDEDFGAGRLTPVDVVIEGNVNSPEVRQAVAELTQRINSDDRFSQTLDLEVSDDGQLGLVQAYVNGDSAAKPALEAVRTLKNDYVPAAFAGVDAEVLVGGDTAATIEGVDTMKHYLPIVIGFVLSLSFVLLLVVFRSVVIPVKAIAMNLLSVGAAYGLIVAVFQHGIGASLLGFQQTDTVAAWLPVFLFAILFGLSMDYHVFLLSRIQERFLKTGDNRESVASGLQSTAHIISGAAAIMVVVFGAFALGDMVDMQQMGFGLAVAVFIDATLIRSILVPASMELLGDRNWYLPSWLEWLPRLNVEGHAPAPSRPVERRTSGDLIPVPVRVRMD